MLALTIYEEDLKIAKSLINRDENITICYYYKQCYPLFKSIYDNYYTDCHSCMEFMNEIYLLILAPGKKTGKCQLENYKGESTLNSWLKTVCLFYCYHKYKLKRRLPPFEPLESFNNKENNVTPYDKFHLNNDSIDIDLRNMNRNDVEVLINLMPTLRYRKIIHMLYLEQRAPQEIADVLGISLEVYYNKRRLAEKQFKKIHNRENKI